MANKTYLAKSKISKKLSVSVPSAIRTKFDLDAGDTIYWDIEGDNIIIRLNQEE